MEGKINNSKAKPKTVKQKAKLQQIMSITIENLSKKNKPEESPKNNQEQSQKECIQKFNTITEQDYSNQLDAYYQEQNKRFSFSQPAPDPYQVQLMQQQQQFQQVLNKQQDFPNQSPKQKPQQSPLGQSQQIQKQQQNMNESHMTNFTQQSPVFIPQLHISQVNQQSFEKDNTKKSSHQQDEQFQMNSQLDDSQEVPQVLKMSIKSEHMKKQSKQQNNTNTNISNILDNFLSHRQKIGDQSALNQSELFEFSNLQHFGGGNDDQSLIQQQSLLHSMHNDTQPFHFEDICQNVRKDSSISKSIVAEQEDDIEDLLQELYECTTKQLPKKIVETNPKIVNQKGKEVMSTLFENKQQNALQQQSNQNIPYLTGSKLISEQKPDVQSPIIKSNLQQEIFNSSTSQYQSQEQEKLSEKNMVSQFGGINENSQIKDAKQISPLIKNESNQPQETFKYQSIQDKLKNSLKIKEAEQPLPQEVISNTKPFQLSSTDRNFKAKQSFGYELTFRTPQKHLLNISQYLFKYTKLIQEPNLKRLSEIKIDCIKKNHDEHLISGEMFDYKSFETLISEKDPDFLQLIKTNLILYQQGEPTEQNITKWSKSHLPLHNLNYYLFSLGFTYDKQAEKALLEQIEEYQTTNKKADKSQLEVDVVFFAIYLAFKSYPDYSKLMDIVQFLCDAETKLIDVETAKLILGKIVQQEQINNVFKWPDSQISHELLYKVLTLLPY